MKYSSMIPATDWFFVHKNDASSKTSHTVHHLAVWALKDPGSIVGLLPVIDVKANNSTTAILVQSPPIRGEYIHRDQLTDAMLESMEKHRK